MNSSAFQISLSYNQILDLVRQLPNKEKERLSKDLEKETKDQILTRLLGSFRTDEISQDEIDKEVKSVRAEIYAQKKKN